MNVDHILPARILLVEDDSRSLGSLFEYLVNYKFTVFVAQSGEAALRLLKEEQPELILLDVLMPGMDGFTVCRQLKQRDETKDIPVIFMTALSETVDKLKGFDAGGVDYITKPLSHEEVLARVVAHLTIRKLQQQLQEQNTQLQALNASKDKFFSIISHDLRNPFNVLLGLSKLLDDKLDSYSKERIRRHVKKMRTSAEKLYALLENLLTWSRVQRGAMEYYPEQIQLLEIAEHNVALFSHAAEEKNITLRHSVPADVVVYADYSMVDTVSRNLISNALKFTNSDGTVVLSAECRDHDVIVSVSDTGVGIPEDLLPQIFREDAQHSTPGTAGEKGTGLGLGLCQELVERNDGKIWVESEAGKGSVFRFSLPIAPKEDPARET